MNGTGSVNSTCFADGIPAALLLGSGPRGVWDTGALDVQRTFGCMHMPITWRYPPTTAYNQ